MPSIRHRALAVLTLAFAACSSREPSGAPLPATAHGNADPRAALAAARATWAARQVAGYWMTLERGCFCPPEWRGPITVTQRAPGEVAMRYAASGEPVPAEVREHFHTVAGLFDVVQRALDANAAEVRVTYDAAWGYPTTIWVDHDRNVADEEQGYTVTAFEALP